MKRNILIYYQNPYHSVFFESFIQELADQGHQVFFLTKCEPGILHDIVRKMGVRVDTYNPRGKQFFRFFLHIFYLIRYCRKNKIEVVYSHLQLANLIACVAQYFVRAKVFPCRHHADVEILIGNKTAMRIDRTVNRLAKKIVVVSNAVKRHMIAHEKVNEKKIKVIPLGYDFDLYDKPDPEKVAAIRAQMNCHLLLIMVSRMNPRKRHIIALEALKQLVGEGLDIKLILLDGGPEEKNLRAFVDKNSLNDRVMFTGFLPNTMNHLAAADILVQPSESEASNQVVKEAAILEKPSIVCAGVGDFDEYVIHKVSGFVVPKEDPREEVCSVLRECYQHKEDMESIGRNIREAVLKKFTISSVVGEYLQLAG